MKTNGKKILSAAAVIPALLLCSCGNTESKAPEAATAAATTAAATTVTEETAPAIAESFPADLTIGYEHVSKLFEMSDGWTNGSMFNCTWRKKNCTFDDGKMSLSIGNEMEGLDPPYSAAEFRTKDFYGYGYYEVTMKPIANNGVVSSFFTYTGPSDKNPWDEIDIEFLGKDTTKVQFNYFTNSMGGHEYIHDLGFDAAEDFHTYGFDWKQDSITWYVDGAEVYTANDNIPSTPGKIMMNVWPGTGVDGWLNAFDGTVPLHAEYTYVNYTEGGK